MSKNICQRGSLLKFKMSNVYFNITLFTRTNFVTMRWCRIGNMEALFVPHLAKAYCRLIGLNIDLDDWRELWSSEGPKVFVERAVRKFNEERQTERGPCWTLVDENGISIDFNDYIKSVTFDECDGVVEEW